MFGRECDTTLNVVDEPSWFGKRRFLREHGVNHTAQGPDIDSCCVGAGIALQDSPDFRGHVLLTARERPSFGYAVKMLRYTKISNLDCDWHPSSDKGIPWL